MPGQQVGVVCGGRVREFAQTPRLFPAAFQRGRSGQQLLGQSVEFGLQGSLLGTEGRLSLRLAAAAFPGDLQLRFQVARQTRGGSQSAADGRQGGLEISDLRLGDGRHLRIQAFCLPQRVREVALNVFQ